MSQHFVARTFRGPLLSSRSAPLKAKHRCFAVDETLELSFAGWVDVMLAAVDSRGPYLQPKPVPEPKTWDTGGILNGNGPT
jgi:hypothetical protein